MLYSFRRLQDSESGKQEGVLSDSLVIAEHREPAVLDQSGGH